jgi:hypothetical protein
MVPEKLIQRLIMLFPRDIHIPRQVPPEIYLG